MSTQTAALPDGTKLTKPASGEKVSLSVINTNTDNIANNIIALNSKLIRTTSNNITGVSGSNNAGFILNLMQRLASTYDFSALQFCDVIAGRAEWAGVDYVHFTVTKVTGTTWNVFITASSRIVTGYYNASSGTVTGVNDIINQIATINSNKAATEKTAFTPVIPRITYSELADNYAIRSGDIVYARARFKVDSVDTGNTYINGNSFPIFGGTLRYISGIWSDENNDTGGEIHGSSNGNAWFMKNGANYRLDANTGHTIWISATYAIDNS